MDNAASAEWQLHDEIGRRKYLNDAERQRFLAIADGLNPARRALCYVLAYSGCRVSEALSLQPHQLDTELKMLQIRCLKRRCIIYRRVPMPTLVVDMLTALPIQGERFWTIHRGTVWSIVAAIMRQARVSGPMACPKGLRHGFGIRAAATGVPAPIIQRWMGHAYINTTLTYVDAVGIEERAFAERMWAGCIAN